jgi:tetratricopeptide (TPR) repeat protein
VRLRAALLVVVPLAAYALAPRGGFIWDDHKSIEHGRLIGSLRHVPALFTHDTMFNSDGGAFQSRAAVDTYRPLTMTTFFVEHALWGARPLGYHVTGVLLHLACVLVLYRVGRRLALAEWAATAGALAFAAHPALGEAVYWINGRSDPLCVLCFLLALWAWLDGRALACAAAMLAATLAKETAFVLAPPIVLLLARREIREPWWRALAPWAAGGALGLALRLLALSHTAAGAGAGHARYALARLPAVWLDALRSLAVPTAEMPASLFARYRHPGAAWTIVSAIVLALAIALAVRARRSLFPWALATFLLTTAPIALLTFDEGWFGWGRYLYPAAPALALAFGEALLGALARLRPSLRQIAAGASFAALAVCAGQTFAAARDWRDDEAFARAMIADHPDSAPGWDQLAVVLLERGRAAGALDAAEHAIALEPGRARHLTHAASALMALGRRAEAFDAARRALELDRDDPHAQYLAAIGLLGAHQETRAAELLLDAIAGDPTQDGPWTTLGQAAAHLGPSSELVLALRRLLAEPRYAAIAPRALSILNAR